MRKIKWYIRLIFPFLLSVTTCIEPFEPDSTKYENVLVVDGLITNLQESYKVELSRSIPYQDFSPDPEIGAEVYIVDEDGVSTPLHEVKPGIYMTDSLEIRGEIGRKYKLLIITSDLESYESDYVELQSVPEIDTLYYKYEEVETSDPNNPLQGAQIYLSTHDPDNKTWYYRWEWLETWEFTTPFVASGRINLYRCWRSLESRSINTATSKRLTQDLIKDHPLNYISQQSNRLSIMYSILVRQYSLSSEAYAFWKSLENVNQNMGSLFDPTPTSVLGNLHHVEDPEHPVLGYFQASAVTTKRLFIDRTDLPKEMVVSSGYDYCDLLIAENPEEEEIEAIVRNNWIYLDNYTIGPTTYYRFTNSISCYDCRTKGTTKRPLFWPDDSEY